MNISFAVSMMLIIGVPLLMYAKREVPLEKSIPIFNIALVVTLYLFAYIGFLQMGVWLIVSVQFLLFLYAIYTICQKKYIIKLLKEPITLLSSSIVIVLVYGDRGKLASGWDEFSHWMDTVKAISYINDFCTSQISHCGFGAYPPAMSLFQYYFQKIHFLIDRTAIFNEWQMYFAYQIFLLSLFLPFLLMLGKENRFSKYFSATIMILLLLLVFYDRFFALIYIDPAVAILFGCGVAAVLLYEKYDTWYFAYETGICALLPIVKDAGLYFGIFLAVIFLIDIVINRKGILALGIDKKKFIAVAFTPFVATLTAKLSWKLEIARVGLNSYDKIDIVYFTKLFFGWDDGTYRKDVVNLFKYSFKEARFYEVSNFPVSYCQMTIIGIALSLLAAFLLWREGRHKIRTTLLVILSVLFYVYSLGATYVSNFSEYEASRLASYDRYMNMAYLGWYIVIFIVMISLLLKNKKYPYFFMMILVFFVMFSPGKYLGTFLKREYVAESWEARNKYENMKSIIEKCCDGDDKIWLISQGDRGYDYWVNKFNARPNWIASGGAAWNLGGPFHGEDIETIQRTAEEWRSMLIDGEYEYLALFRTNDYFKETYGELFVNEEDISDETLFKFDCNTGLFTKCNY